MLNIMDSAISVRDFPLASNFNTENSRSDKCSCNGLESSCSIKFASFSATDSVMYLFPEITLFTAPTNSSGAKSLLRYPDAPAFNTLTA